MNNLTAETLREKLHYDPDTGVFTWRVSTGRAKAGNIAGTKHDRGYQRIQFKGQTYYAHRLAWFLHHKEWPKNEIDHINHITSDNRIENLRVATPQENKKNRRISSNNTSGVMGVVWFKARKKWLARIVVDDKLLSLGAYSEWWDAVCARKYAEYKYKFHANHGKI